MNLLGGCGKRHSPFFIYFDDVPANRVTRSKPVWPAEKTWNGRVRPDRADAEIKKIPKKGLTNSVPWSTVST